MIENPQNKRKDAVPEMLISPSDTPTHGLEGNGKYASKSEHALNKYTNTYTIHLI